MRPCKGSLLRGHKRFYKAAQESEAIAGFWFFSSRGAGRNPGHGMFQNQEQRVPQEGAVPTEWNTVSTQRVQNRVRWLRRTSGRSLQWPLTPALPCRTFCVPSAGSPYMVSSTAVDLNTANRPISTLFAEALARIRSAWTHPPWLHQPPPFHILSHSELRGSFHQHYLLSVRSARWWGLLW